MTVGLPCKNPSCKSHGVPHPNCKCYGDMAEGGEVETFCSKERKHEPDCEYFSDGSTAENPLHPDSHHSVASYLAHSGLHNLLKLGSDSSDSILDKYNLAVKKGKKYLEYHMENLFNGSPPVYPDHSKSKEKIHDWISKGGIVHDIEQEIHSQNAPQHFAEGGEAEHKVEHHHPVAKAYPDQNLMLQMAKGRMSDYLNGLKPHAHPQKLAFDNDPDTRQQKKSYDKALHLAAHPLGVLDEIHKGTLESEHIKHFKNLHPEVDQVLQKKLTEKLMKSQLEGKKPPYKIRQGLSMFLGAPLSSEMTPQNMQAVQATFRGVQTQQPEQPASKPKKNTSTLTKADDSYMTGNQARVARQQHQKS